MAMQRVYVAMQRVYDLIRGVWGWGWVGDARPCVSTGGLCWEFDGLCGKNDGSFILGKRWGDFVRNSNKRMFFSFSVLV